MCMRKENICILFVLRFYGSVNPVESCRARSVYLTTRLLGRLSPLSGLPVLCIFFCQKLTNALLESAEGREWLQKTFHDQFPRKNVADLGGCWTRNLLVSSRTHIQLSHWGQLTSFVYVGAPMLEILFYLFSTIYIVSGFICKQHA